MLCQICLSYRTNHDYNTFDNYDMESILGKNKSERFTHPELQVQEFELSKIRQLTRILLCHHFTFVRIARTVYPRTLYHEKCRHMPFWYCNSIIYGEWQQRLNIPVCSYLKIAWQIWMRIDNKKIYFRLIVDPRPEFDSTFLVVIREVRHIHVTCALDHQRNSPSYLPIVFNNQFTSGHVYKSI